MKRHSHRTWGNCLASAWWILPTLALACLAAGCGASDDSGPGCLEPAGRLVDIQGCKGGVLASATDVPADQDCIQYAYGHKTLSLKHVNAALNCCPEVDARVTVSGDTIFIVEDETMGGCHCLCLYDLDYEVVRLPAGEYRVVVSQEYLLEGDPPLEFTIDLGEEPSGSYCVTRNHYPWGTKSPS